MRRFYSLICIAMAAVMAIAADKGSSYALINISVACVRANPSHSSELVTQQLMGFPVKIKADADGWAEVETMDGYNGYIIDNSLYRLTPAQYQDWRESRRVIYSAFAEGKVTGEPGCGEVVSDIVPGVIVCEVSRNDESVEIRLPDGRTGYVPAERATPLEQWARQEYSPELILDYARSNIGSPYLWGGLSVKAMDCSGLTWLAYFLNGRLLKRDASTQAAMSTVKIKDQDLLKPGDLLFFGNEKTKRVNHVAIYEADGRYLHSSGRLKRNSLRPADKDFIAASFLFAVDYSSADVVAPIFDSPEAAWLFIGNPSVAE